ncbi:uncharacterized protein SOCE836_051980 [Sorangium cellulosum]|uniref:PEGA domain-containing protein n=1 Tax=Sorangium cellulosum TaxID=56 RepID=A0A4P2QSM2_SORCE|nr:uncharacterized protein SOCE836_051980 [Sorangium cellulosum]
MPAWAVHRGTVDQEDVGAVPKLVIELAQGAPAPSEVLLDGAALPQASLGSELPLDPGTHAVVAQWTDGRQTEAPVIITEGARKILRLAPPPIEAAPTPAVAAPRAGSRSKRSWISRKNARIHRIVTRTT